MTPRDSDIRDYFASHFPSLWDWQEHGEVVAWADGGTIAFRLEVAAILLRLRTCGWPRFGSLVLLMGACRKNWTTSASAQQTIHGLIQYFHQATDAYEMVVGVLSGLDRVHELRELLTTPAAKAELAAMVFEVSPSRLSPPASGELQAAFDNGLTDDQIVGFQSDPLDSILADLGCLRDGLLKLDRAALESRLRTGLDQTVCGLSVELPPGEAVRALIRDHADDELIGGVLRLARWLIVAVQLPRALSDPEDLPVGGINDLSNRGPLDRLLLSELAHDELTLAVRVAMNEAMFLRREPLARPQTRQRIVVLDSGLRVWGVPRVFVAAVGLAMASQATRELDVHVYRAHGDGLAPVDFTTPQGVADHLSKLNHQLHPGQAMPAVVELANAAHSASDVVIVTGDDTVGDREFNRCLADAGVRYLHLCAVNRDGGFRLLRRSPAGQKVIKQAKYSLDDVLLPRVTPSTPLVDRRERDSHLPAICVVDEFPLRLSVDVKVENSWFVHQVGVFTYVTSGRLLLWDRRGFGAVEVATSLPSGKLHWCSSTPKFDMITLVFGKLSSRGLYVMRLNVNTKERSVRRLNQDSEQPRRVFEHAGVIFVRYDDHVTAFDSTTGERYGSVASPNVRHLHGRFGAMASGHGVVFAYSYDGQTVQINPLMHLSAHPNFATIVDADRIPTGPVAIMTNGEFLFLGSGEPAKAKLPEAIDQLKVAAVSRDGMRFVYDRNTERQPKFLVYVASGLVKQVRGDPQAAVEEPIFNQVTLRQFRRRFRGIGVSLDGRLGLVSRGQSYWPIYFDSRAGHILFSTKAYSFSTPERIVEFEGMDCDYGFELSAATWPDGSRAILDSRGLLHLQSSDKSIPECTIVLCEGKTSGWVLDGRCWGEPYYLGERIASSTSDIYSSVLLQFVKRLP